MWANYVQFAGSGLWLVYTHKGYNENNLVFGLCSEGCKEGLESGHRGPIQLLQFAEEAPAYPCISLGSAREEGSLFNSDFSTSQKYFTPDGCLSLCLLPGARIQPRVHFQRRALKLPENTSYSELTAFLTSASLPWEVDSFPYLQGYDGSGTGKPLILILKDFATLRDLFVFGIFLGCPSYLLILSLHYSCENVTKAVPNSQDWIYYDIMQLLLQRRIWSSFPFSCSQPPHPATLGGWETLKTTCEQLGSGEWIKQG